MNFKTYTLPFGFDKKECYVQARLCAFDEENLLLTLQKLNVAGSDLFSAPYIMHSADGGKSWTQPKADFIVPLTPESFFKQKRLPFSASGG